jgi:hypothetical protein
MLSIAWPGRPPAPIPSFAATGAPTLAVTPSLAADLIASNRKPLDYRAVSTGEVRAGETPANTDQA